MSMKRFWLGATLAATLLAAPAAAKDELVIGVSQFPTGLHPNLNSHATTSYVLGMAHRPFTTSDADWETICLLCTELPDEANGTARLWETEDGTPGRAIDYAIRPDAVWGDGTPVTTRDVLFVYDMGRDETVGFGNLEMYRNIEKVEVHDDKRFTLFINRRDCEYQGINDFRVVPAHLEAALADDRAEYRYRTLYETDPTNPGLYFGPYRVTRVEPGATIVLEPNETWWGEPPAFKRIVVRTIENTAALEANLLSGEIDMIAGEAGITLDQGLAFEKRHGDDYQVIFQPGLIYEHIDVMLDNPVLADVRVRRALMYATDREAISERLFEGRQPVAHGGVNPLDSVYYADVPKYEFDPQRAIALLEEAGWSEVVDGVRQNAAGERLSFVIMSTAGNRIRELVQQVLQSQWRAVGIELTIRNEPPRVLFGETIRQRNFDHLAMFAWISSPQNIPWTTLHSSMIPTADNNWSGQNYTGYVEPEMDTALTRVREECGDEVQDELWAEIQTRYAEDLPALPLYFRANVFVLPKWLEGLRPTGHQYPSTLWVENWHAR